MKDLQNWSFLFYAFAMNAIILTNLLPREVMSSLNNNIMLIFSLFQKRGFTNEKEQG